MAGSPDLFVVCKSCGSEVSPYITECPYCGTRLRKRAPKIERDAEGDGQPKERRKLPRPTLGPLRAGEIPGIAADETRRPYVTIGLVLLGLFGYLLMAFVDVYEVALFSQREVRLEGETVTIAAPPGDLIGGKWYSIATSSFIYASQWFQLAVLVSVGLCGWLLERRHGSLFVVVLYLAAGVGPIAGVAALFDEPNATGANGAALGFLAAYAVPVLLARRRTGDDDDDVDLIGVGILFVLVVLMPIATPAANPLVGSAGLVVGGLVGLALARFKPRV